MDSYDSEGKAAKAAAEKDEVHAGHPQGKRPDALFRAVLHHLQLARREQEAARSEDMTESGQQQVFLASKAAVAAGEKAPQKR
eukprot:4398403-Pyramimonas_sp.AAC.1